RLNSKIARQPRAPHRLHHLAGPQTPFTLLLRRDENCATLVAINPACDAPVALDWELINARTGGGVPRNAARRASELAPCGVLSLALERGKPVQTLRRKMAASKQRETLHHAMQASRIVIQDLEPSLPVR